MRNDHQDALDLTEQSSKMRLPANRPTGFAVWQWIEARLNYGVTASQPVLTTAFPDIVSTISLQRCLEPISSIS